MFGLGMPEILMILAIALIVIGPKKLPDLAKTLGSAMGEFKRSAQDFKQSIDMETTINDVTELENITEDINSTEKINSMDEIDSEVKDQTQSRDDFTDNSESDVKIPSKQEQTLSDDDDNEDSNQHSNTQSKNNSDII